jgi:hypothetical protein
VGAPRIFYEVSARKLADQLRSVDLLDAKAGTMFGFATGLLAFYAVVFSFSRVGTNKAFALWSIPGSRLLAPRLRSLVSGLGWKPPSREWIAPISTRLGFLIILGLSLALYGAIVFILRRAYAVSSRWVFRPDLSWLESHARLHSESEMQILIAQQYKRSFEENRDELLVKVRRTNLALTLLAVEAAFAGATGLLALLLR